MTLRRMPVLLGLALALAACTSDDGTAPPAAAGSPSSAPAPSATGSGPPSATSTPSLPAGCDAVLPFTDLDQALGRPLFGGSRYIVGVAQPSIGRTGRVTCQYGLAPNGKGAAPLEVGMSTYKDAASAADRVEATVAALRAGATSQKAATVAGQPTTVIGFKTGVTAVLAQGDRTLAVTVSRAISDPGRAALAVAEKVLAAWGQ
ncbi:MAG TPA: hypothetical protein VI357_03430 [Mycobacteriales bacterium]